MRLIDNNALASYEAAVQLFHRRKWKEAFAAFQRLADRGDILALVAMGNMYLAGRGVQRDLSEAARLLGRAAELGNPAAKFALGRLCQAEGDHRAGATLLNEAASKGYFPALYSIGVACELGLGTEPDLPKAVSLYRRAADFGHVPARARLGRLGLSGYFGVAGRVAGIWLSVTAMVLAFWLVLTSPTDLRIVH